MVVCFVRFRLPHGRRVVTALAVVAAACAFVGCGTDAPPPADTSPRPSSPAATAPPTSPTTTPSPVPPAAAVTSVATADLGATWRPGCPVGPERLRRVELNHLGFDGRTHRGELVVHEQVVAQVIEIFEHLYRLGYPIAKMRTVEHYPGADDELSMRDNNTSAFNCRGIPGSQSWSYHAYGRAIDLNPLLNPYIGRSGAVEPANAGPYADRGRTDPGILHAADPAVLAFTDRGWHWGGDWRTPKDYQHFEQP
ncbi:M15 family metallopeptidase [Mycolicibacterium baixiangningiae]|uniref:M15 family metallopeptidase n=1 Tax=Mycolicibacterium baixiangningiae TaxID=2761578 RepID=UPI001865F089|nr:M15 family metallopeptidase [Mycolicibacterium baixiangningiae]